MIPTRTINFALASPAAVTLPLAAAERYFAEPVHLKGRAIYFTSWTHVRQGSFAWRVQVSLNASEAARQVGAWLKGEGEFATVFIVPASERLRVNANVAPSGFLKVAIRVWGNGDDLPGRGWADCDRVIGNSLAARVTWKGEETIGHKGQPIMLRVQMKQAKLFGVGFGE